MTNNDDDEFSRPHYFQAVESIAKEAMAYDEDDREDYIHESVDGSRRVFISFGAQRTLQHSPNAEIMFDEIGAEDALRGCRSLSDIHTRAAYYAMRADVAEALARLVEEAEEAEEAAAD